MVDEMEGVVWIRITRSRSPISRPSSRDLVAKAEWSDWVLLTF